MLKFQVATSIISKFKHIKLNEHNSLRKTFEQETKYGLFGPLVWATIIHLVLSQNLTKKPLWRAWPFISEYFLN